MVIPLPKRDHRRGAPAEHRGRVVREHLAKTMTRRAVPSPATMAARSGWRGSRVPQRPPGNRWLTLKVNRIASPVPRAGDGRCRIRRAVRHRTDASREAPGRKAPHVPCCQPPGSPGPRADSDRSSVLKTGFPQLSRLRYCRSRRQKARVQIRPQLQTVFDPVAPIAGLGCPMFESWFVGPVLVALISTAIGVAIGASRPAPVHRREAAEARLFDQRRVFGRKRGWRRATRAARGLGLLPLR